MALGRDAGPDGGGGFRGAGRVGEAWVLQGMTVIGGRLLNPP